jgi:hypothetical protein
MAASEGIDSKLCRSASAMMRSRRFEEAGPGNQAAVRRTRNGIDVDGTLDVAVWRMPGRHRRIGQRYSGRMNGQRSGTNALRSTATRSPLGFDLVQEGEQPSRVFAIGE